jgi:hypothetical protein
LNNEYVATDKLHAAPTARFRFTFKRISVWHVK